MRLFFQAFLSAALLLFGNFAGAQDLTDKQPSYTRIAAKCGEDPSRPSFSSADYAAAFGDAAKALKSAAKEGNRARATAIQNSLERLNECMEEETRKFTVPTINNCADFVIEFQAFTDRAYLLWRSGKISSAERRSKREMFRKPAMDCVRHIMSKCIDPTDTRTIDFVIMVMQAASVFQFIGDYSTETGLRRLLITKDPRVPKMSFCTDTDYSCRGDPQACSNRITQIKAIMQTFMDE